MTEFGALSARIEGPLPSVLMAIDDGHPADSLSGLLVACKKSTYNNSSGDLSHVSVDGSAGVPNRHVNCMNKGIDKVKCANMSLHNHHTSISFACWNIAGWNHKDSSFRENVVNALKYDVIGLVETHLRFEEVISVPNYM